MSTFFVCAQPTHKSRGFSFFLFWGKVGDTCQRLFVGGLPFLLLLLFGWHFSWPLNVFIKSGKSILLLLLRTTRSEGSRSLLLSMSFCYILFRETDVSVQYVNTSSIFFFISTRRVLLFERSARFLAVAAVAAAAAAEARPSPRQTRSSSPPAPRQPRRARARPR